MTSPTAFSDYSRFAQRVRRRYGAELCLLPDCGLNRKVLETFYDALLERGYDCGAALRTCRQLILERLIRLDCDGGAALSVVMNAMTVTAEFALDVACREAQVALEQKHGIPTAPGGARANFWIVGMGKLGARELNASSDIDLVYLYDHDGETSGADGERGRISNQEYFAKLVRGIYALIGEPNEHGFVFRVDLALRPNGNSGPTALSLSALEDYLHVQGREWERFAWLKSRVVAPSSSVKGGSASTLRNVVLPFVFRRYLDYSVFDALRNLHQQIRDNASRLSTGRPERANDVKLSRGGIREIEFTVQLLQVVRGGQYPELRTRPTLDALQRLAKAGLMPISAANALAEAYTFLRRVEHRIQYLDDLQTHMLPTDDRELNWIAQSLGFEGTCAFLRQLDTQRECVAQEFDRLLGAKAGKGQCRNCIEKVGTFALASDLEGLLSQLHGSFKARVDAWRNQPRILALRDESRSRLWQLVARTAQWERSGHATEAACLQWLDWTESLLRRESYLALLLERPVVHERLLKLLGSARWPARYLLMHPGVIDELASSDMLAERFHADEFCDELRRRKAALQATHEDDDETLLNLLRRAHHAEVFRTLARDIEGALSVEQVADDLSALAEAVLQITLQWCWQRLKSTHRAEPQVAILAYGKLGGKELGYGSDLDIVFLYADDDERAAECYSALVRKLINWLTVKTGEGDLYEIDTALRPNGNSGLLVTTFDAFANYQQQRGSNAAWTWEHQAMTRARMVVGDASMLKRFESIRTAVIVSARVPQALQHEVVAMRRRLSSARSIRIGQFDVKYSPGGMLDVEFAVQYLVLMHARAHPELRANVGNIALLGLAEQRALLSPGIGFRAANAYRQLRQIQHTARLNETSTQIASETCKTQCDAILALWRDVFAESTDP